MPPTPASSTHDWSNPVDEEHLRAVSARAADYAATGVVHLLVEVLAYADDEAAETGSRRCVVSLHRDGTVSVADSGRGTDTRVDGGEAVKKPVMSSKDLRFFDADPSVLLPDGCPRRGMSVVAALSSRLVHLNRRANGSWRQEYRYGVPSTGLVRTVDDGTTGTTVEFTAVASLQGLPASRAALLPLLDAWAHLDVELVDGREGG